MIKYTTYQVCSSCFSTMFHSGSFDTSQPLVLVDHIEGVSYQSYLLDESVPCNPEVHDELNA